VFGRRPARYLLIAALVWLAATPAGVYGRPAADLVASPSDAEFWRLVEDLSEPAGFFRSDNLVSNEDAFQEVIPDLRRLVRPGGVYVGVGPDQNFTYLAAIEPRLAFILDIRRGNLHLQLMYKAIMELSADRADFLSRLFARPRPAGLGPRSSAEELFAAYARVAPSFELYEANRRAVLAALIERRQFPLGDEDLAGITRVLLEFFRGGPDLAYAGGGLGRTRYPTFQDLQMMTDGRGRNHAYLGTEAAFRIVKALQDANRIVPVVGNFAGPKALRAIGRYVRARSGTVTAFYASNVEQYLFQDGVWPAFADNLAALPLDGTSTLIRSCFTRCQTPLGARSVTLLDSMTGLVRDATAGRIATYWDVLARRPGAPERIRAR